MQNFSENIDLVIAKLTGGQMGFGATLTLPCLHVSTGNWQSWSIIIIALIKCEDYHAKN